MALETHPKENMTSHFNVGFVGGGSPRRDAFSGEPGGGVPACQRRNVIGRDLRIPDPQAVWGGSLHGDAAKRDADTHTLIMVAVSKPIR